MTATVQENRDASRFEVHVDGELAGVLTYRLRDDTITLVHTEVEDEHEGQGLAKELTVHALQAARDAGLAVVPTCPYVAEYIRRHPDQYADLVPEDRRAEFGL